MATRKIVLEGKAHWVRLFEDNRDMTGWNDSFVPFNGAYTIEMDLDAENTKKLQDSGSAVQMNKQGRYKFKRKHEDRFDWASGAPEVEGPDGQPWSFEEDGVVWNESLVRLHLDVYDTSGKCGTRITKAEIKELAEKPEDREEA